MSAAAANAATHAAVLERLDPALTGVVPLTLPAALPAGPLTVELVRRVDASLVSEPVETARVVRIGRTDGSALELRLHETERADAAILWIHGGGMFLGSARQDDALCRSLSSALGTTVVAVDYRLAPEHPHPAPLEDCYTALDWLAHRYPRVVVAGGSAGGGLAAGLALLARDRSGPAIAGLHLSYPMLDDRESPMITSELADTVVWNARLDALAWEAYLGGSPADQYAAPGRAADLSGLPPTVIDAGDLDLFVHEDIAFAAALEAAGVDVTLTVETGAPHCFEFILPDTDRSRATLERKHAALAGLLDGGAAR